jgi:hypothetical protein
MSLRNVSLLAASLVVMAAPARSQLVGERLDSTVNSRIKG